MGKSKISFRGISRGTTLAIRSLRNDIRKIFTELSEEEAAAEKAAEKRRMERPLYKYGALAFRYGMLASILVMLAFFILITIRYPSSDPEFFYGIIILALMMLFNHLTSEFKTNHPVWRYGLFAYRYGILVLIFGLLAWRIKWHLTLSPSYSYDPYSGHIFALMLLFNHLTGAFKWPYRITVALWILCWSWIAFGLFYICYLSGVLYPLPSLPTP